MSNQRSRLCRGARSRTGGSVRNFAVREFTRNKTIPMRRSMRANLPTIFMTVRDNDLVVASNGDSVNLRVIIRRLFRYAAKTFAGNRIIDRKLMKNMIKYMLLTVLDPISNTLSDGFEPMIHCIIPIIAVNVESGSLMGYGIGKLVAFRNNLDDPVLIAKGFSHSERTSEDMVESIIETL